MTEQDEKNTTFNNRGTPHNPIYVRILESKRAGQVAITELVFFFIGVGIVHHFLPKFHVHMTYWDTFWVFVGLVLIFGNSYNKFTD